MNIKMILTNGFDPDVRVYKEAKFLLSKGHNVEVLCWDRNCENKIFEIYEGISIHRFHIKSTYGSGYKQIFSYIKFLFSVKKYLKHKNFEFLHLHDIDAASYLLISKNKCKTIFDMHEMYIKGKNKFIDFFILKILHMIQRKVNYIIYVNEFQLEYVNKKDKIKCYALPNYPSVKTFYDIEKNFSDKKRIAYIGSVRDFKSLKLLIDTSRQLNDRFIFRIDGMGSEYNSLFQYCKKNNLQNILTGKYEGNTEILEIYKNTDLLYCVYDNSNKNWSTGIAVKFFEGIITHTPIIVNKGGEEEKLIKMYDIGYVIDIHDKTSLKNLLLSITNESYNQKISNIITIENNFRWEDIISVLEKIYE